MVASNRCRLRFSGLGPGLIRLAPEHRDRFDLHPAALRQRGDLHDHRADEWHGLPGDGNLRQPAGQLAADRARGRDEPVERVAIVACGTASYVGMIGKYWIEQMARLPVQ